MEKDERLEKLSDKVRMGQPISFEEACDVIDYQSRLRRLKRERSVGSLFTKLINKIKSWYTN